jgi:hypothetical protein
VRWLSRSARAPSSRQPQDASGLTTIAPPSSTARAEGSEASTTPAAAGGVLLAYFSRAGENYHYGGRRDLDVGNTEVLAGMISRLLGCDVHRIEAADPVVGDPASLAPLPAIGSLRICRSPLARMRCDHAN